MPAQLTSPSTYLLDAVVLVHQLRPQLQLALGLTLQILL